MKLKNIISDSPGIAIVLSVIVATIGGFLSLPINGIFATIPFALILSVCATPFTKKIYYLPTSFFVVTYMIAFFKGTPIEYSSVLGGYALRVAIKATIGSLLGCLAFTTFSDKKALFKSKAAAISLAVLCFAVGVAINAYEAGTPWSYVKAKAEINEFVDSRFETEGFYVSNVYRLPGENKHACDFVLKDDTQTASLVNDNGVIYEDVTELFSARIIATATEELSSVIRHFITNGSFEVSCEYKGFYREKLSLTNTETISNYLKFTVNVYDANTAKTFVESADKYFKAVSNSEYPCTDLTVNGGIRRRMYYSLSGNPYVPTSCKLSQFGKTLIPDGTK